MEVSGKTKISDLLNQYPFLESFLVGYHPKFTLLRNKAMGATVGRVANLRMVSQVGDVKLSDLLCALAAEIEKQTGEKVTLSDQPAQDASLRQERIEVLKQIIRDLHDGGDLETARQRFAKAIADVEAQEIAEMEQQLIKDGLPVQEVQRLCDVHASAFKPMLDQQEEVEAPPGHPIHTYRADNEVIQRLANELVERSRELVACQSEPERQHLLGQVGETLGALGGVENHYQRKENQIFPFLERHDIHFPRSPAIIGRKVQNCHPQKSVHIVQSILDAFRKGEQDTAEFWITLHGKFLHIRYLAVRDEQSRYRGCLEVSQDVTEIRKLEGEQRLLSWEDRRKGLG